MRSTLNNLLFERRTPTMTPLDRLPERHNKALQWFKDQAGITQKWPQPLSDGTLLVCLPKGIYKPKWTKYALSVRQTLDSKYPDNEPVFQSDGSWVYRYFQESMDITHGKSEYTNKGMLECLKDGVPVGVLRQVSGKPNILYHILGVANVVEYENGYFLLKSY